MARLTCRSWIYLISLVLALAACAAPAAPTSPAPGVPSPTAAMPMPQSTSAAPATRAGSMPAPGAAAASATSLSCGGPQAGCTPVEVGSAGAYYDVTPAELAAMLKTKNFPLINVHIPYYAELPSTDAFIPYDQLTQHLDQLPADKRAPIVLYCRSGAMSTEASQELVKLGYTNVWNLAGGMYAWGAAGLPLLNKKP